MSRWDARAIVAAKRDGRRLSDDDIKALVNGYMKGDVPDTVVAAFLMACVLRGMDVDETLALTKVMVESGETMRLGLEQPTVDKHSTGGVADGVTLLFTPVASAMGLFVAKLAGRGLGHTGGTLDKLESIPGIRTDLSPQEIRHQVKEVGCAIAAQSPSLVPADGALYALRDATATVPSAPLVAASVMAKKLAVETDLILLDVKAGSGAFMTTPERGIELARLCLELAKRWGRPAQAAVTDMSQPLGNAIGNALDVTEAIGVLRGGAGGRLRDLALGFAARAASVLLGTVEDRALVRAERAIASGEALERFRRMVEAQGGDPRVVDDPEHVLPRASVVLPIIAGASGVVTTVDGQELGLASKALGAGRAGKEDRIDPAVGIVFRPKIGERVEAGSTIGEIHARSRDDAATAARRSLAAITLSDAATTAPPLVYEWLGEGG